MSSQDNNRYWEQRQQGQSDASKGYAPNPNVPPADRGAYNKGYTGQ